MTVEEVLSEYDRLHCLPGTDKWKQQVSVLVDEVKRLRALSPVPVVLDEKAMILILADELEARAPAYADMLRKGDAEMIAVFRPYLSAMSRAVAVAGAGREKQSAMDRILAERQRQIDVEGWTPEHDDEHADGEMLHAAVIYLHHGTDRAAPMNGNIPMGWPWADEWWRPKDRIRNLERAGALCLAEAERLERCGKPRGHVSQKLNLVLAVLDKELTTPKPSAALRDGWVMVPKEPTPEIVKAINNFYDNGYWNQEETFGHGVYTIALASAPPVPADGWMDISTAPKDGTQFDCWWVLPHGGHTMRRTDCHYNATSASYPVTHIHGGPTDQYPEQEFGWRPTHWQPPPPPPQQDKGEDGR